jgi:hypothetical protein
MNFCPKCNNEMAEGAVFCSACGYSVNNVIPLQTETGPPPAKTMLIGSRILGNIFMILGILGVLVYGAGIVFAITDGGGLLTVVAMIIGLIGTLVVLVAGIIGTRKPKAHIASVSALIFIILLFLVVRGINTASEDDTKIIQRTAEEYLIYMVENSGFHAPTSVAVLRAGYSSAEYGDEYALTLRSTGIFYFTLQAATLGGGQTSRDRVILYGGVRDKEIFLNDDPGNDYTSIEHLLDVARLNTALRNHWESLGID